MQQTEQLDVVDDGDHVLSRASRKRVHDEYLIHRSVIFFVFDAEERVFVNQRSATKDMYPSYWSIAFGGHVQAGETYEHAAVREIEEETGLRDSPFQIGAFQKRTADERENVRLFGVRASEALQLFAEEIEQGQFTSIAELSELLGRHDFLPETPTLMKTLVEYTARKLA